MNGASSDHRINQAGEVDWLTFSSTSLLSSGAFTEVLETLAYGIVSNRFVSRIELVRACRREGVWATHCKAAYPLGGTVRPSVALLPLAPPPPYCTSSSPSPPHPPHWCCAFPHSALKPRPPCPHKSQPSPRLLVQHWLQRRQPPSRRRQRRRSGGGAGSAGCAGERRTRSSGCAAGSVYQHGRRGRVGGSGKPYCVGEDTGRGAGGAGTDDGGRVGSNGCGAACAAAAEELTRLLRRGGGAS